MHYTVSRRSKRENFVRTTANEISPDRIRKLRFFLFLFCSYKILISFQKKGGAELWRPNTKQTLQRCLISTRHSYVTVIDRSGCYFSTTQKITLLSQEDWILTNFTLLFRHSLLLHCVKCGNSAPETLQLLHEHWIPSTACPLTESRNQKRVPLIGCFVVFHFRSSRSTAISVWTNYSSRVTRSWVRILAGELVFFVEV